MPKYTFTANDRKIVPEAVRQVHAYFEFIERLDETQLATTNYEKLVDRLIDGLFKDITSPARLILFTKLYTKEKPKYAPDLPSPGDFNEDDEEVDVEVVIEKVKLQDILKESAKQKIADRRKELEEEKIQGIVTAIHKKFKALNKLGKCEDLENELTNPLSLPFFNNLLKDINSEERVLLFKTKYRNTSSPDLSLPDLFSLENKDKIVEELVKAYQTFALKKYNAEKAKESGLPPSPPPPPTSGVTGTGAAPSSKPKSLPTDRFTDKCVFFPPKSDLYETSVDNKTTWKDKAYGAKAMFEGGAIFSINIKHHNLSAEDLKALGTTGLKQTSASGTDFYMKANLDNSLTAELRNEDIKKFEGETPKQSHQRLMRDALDLTISVLGYSSTSLNYYGTDKYVVTAGVMFGEGITKETSLGFNKLKIEHNPDQAFKKTDPEYKEVETFVKAMFKKLKAENFAETHVFKKVSELHQETKRLIR